MKLGIIKKVTITTDSLTHCLTCYTSDASSDVAALNQSAVKNFRRWKQLFFFKIILCIAESLMINGITKILPKLVYCFHVGENFLIDTIWVKKYKKKTFPPIKIFWVSTRTHTALYTIQLFPISTVRLTQCVNWSTWVSHQWFSCALLYFTPVGLAPLVKLNFEGILSCLKNFTQVGALLQKPNYHVY